jgi:hypothetical protein
VRLLIVPSFFDNASLLAHCSNLVGKDFFRGFDAAQLLVGS